MSRELFEYTAFYPSSDGFNIVVKNNKQLQVFYKNYRVSSFFYGVNDFISKVSNHDATCIVFSSGVSVDLILHNYNVLVSGRNPLMTDDMARQVLDTVLHTSSETGGVNLYGVKYKSNTSLYNV